MGAGRLKEWLAKFYKRTSSRLAIEETDTGNGILASIIPDQFRHRYFFPVWCLTDQKPVGRHFLKSFIANPPVIAT
jgi:hypothetical protein